MAVHAELIFRHLQSAGAQAVALAGTRRDTSPERGRPGTISHHMGLMCDLVSPCVWSEESDRSTLFLYGDRR